MKKSITFVLCFVVLSAFAAFGIAQEEKKPVLPAPVATCEIPCPIPWKFTLTAPPPVTATPHMPDFPSLLAHEVLEPNFNGIQHDRHFRHTFRLSPPTDCCQYLSGKLTIKYKPIVSMEKNASNDDLKIWKNGSALATVPLYPTPSQTTITISLTPAMLAEHRLSFAVQDDTSVTSATLEVVACCVRRM